MLELAQCIVVPLKSNRTVRKGRRIFQRMVWISQEGSPNKNMKTAEFACTEFGYDPSVARLFALGCRWLTKLRITDPEMFKSEVVKYVASESVNQ